MTRFGRLVVVGIWAVAAPGLARAGGFALAEQSAVAGGTAGAGTARSADASAGWYNPAALADQHGWRAQIGILAAIPSLTSQALDGTWTTDSESRVLTPPHLYVSHARGRRAFGLAVGIPFGAGVSWPSDWPGRYEIVSSSLEVVRATPWAAWSFGKTRVAAGVHVDFGRLRVARKLDFVDTEGDVALDLVGVGVGVDASIFHSLGDAIDLGFTYKSRTALSLSGDADFTVPDAFSDKAADQGARAELTLPDRFAAGVAWRAARRLTIFADVELTLWESYDELVIDFDEEQTPDVHQVTDWRTTLGVRAGAEIAASSRLVLRGGAFFDPTPAPASTLAPTSPDSTRVGFTLGLGYALSRTLSVDAFYELLVLLPREAEGDEHLAAEYSGVAQIVGLGVRFTPGAR